MTGTSLGDPASPAHDAGYAQIIRGRTVVDSEGADGGHSKITRDGSSRRRDHPRQVGHRNIVIQGGTAAGKIDVGAGVRTREEIEGAVEGVGNSGVEMELAAGPHGHGAHTDLVALQENKTVGVGATEIVADDDVTVDGVDSGGLVEPQVPSHHEIAAGDGVGVAASQFDSSGSRLIEEAVGGNRGGRIVAAADDLAA